MSIAASVAFEQSYGPIDGDSASAAELIAILSAIANVPLHQGIAITGSINQHGQMQPIGGANEKIEGFFDICAARGLERHHGVIIPKANTVSLMLRDDVVEAAAKGLFSIYAVACVDEAIEVLTGMTAGAYARSRGVSITTVYTHLRRTREKTGWRSVAELTRRFNELNVSLRTNKGAEV